MASRTSSTNGALPNHPPPPVAPTTVEKFLGIPTTTSVHFACTLFTLVETFAVLLSGVAGASYNSPVPASPPPSPPPSSPSCSGTNGAAYAISYPVLIPTANPGRPPPAPSPTPLPRKREIGLEGVTAVGGKKGGEEREEQPEVVEEEESAAAAPPPSTTGTGTKQPIQPLHRRLSCIPEEEGDDSSEHGGDDHPPAALVLSQEAQDLVWNRVRYLAARETPRERRRKKLLVRRAMRESQGESTRGWSGDGGYSAMPADSAQRMREEDLERLDSDRDRARDRQGEVDGGLRKGGERMEGVLGGTRVDGDTRVAFSSGQPLFTTLPTMSTNSICPVPQQQTFPAMENLSHLPAAMDRTDPQQQAWHIEAMNRFAHAKDSEIATLRTQMAGMTRYFRTQEEACRAAHAAEVANAWRNAQVLFEKVGKLEGMLATEKIARKEVEAGEGEWIGVGSAEQEERLGRNMGIFTQEEKKGERLIGVENDSAKRRQQQQQQEDEEVVKEEVRKGNNVDGPVIDLPLCQNAGCFCHFPVVPQQPQKQQPQLGSSSGEEEFAITSHDHVDETNDDDNAFTIIPDNNSPSLSSSSHDIESPNNPTPPDGDETPLCQNADCFCHFPVVVRPYLPHTGQTEQREKEQTAQNDDLLLIGPDHVDSVGSQKKNEKDNEDAGDENDGEDEDAFTIIVESRVPPPPSSFSTPSPSLRAESPEDLASMEGSEISLSEWEMDNDDFDSDSGSDSDSNSDFDGLDERIHV
ncbi:hypothetical protein KC353_g6412 [Hortaea werneckii]|nr:hypothetical protein KC353_g6412 [Hortaea werneckii]